MTSRSKGGTATSSPAAERWISLGPDTAPLPERLLLSHARGLVLFISGAGTSMPSGLPDFKHLVLQAYQDLDASVYGALIAPPASRPTPSGLLSNQLAEVDRFDRGDYDVVLGMLERRIDGPTSTKGRVRQRLGDLLRKVSVSGRRAPPKPAAIHRSLIRLANRGVATTIATTNFDRLLQSASSTRVPTFSLGAIPRPSVREDFGGVMHIHGALPKGADEALDVVVTDRDFGEFYLRRRTVPDFVYDAARLFNIVLVGYSANDAPMRYLLNAVAADGSRFRDLRERFAFVPSTRPYDQVQLEDWRGRGITPIPYDSSRAHRELASTLQRWAELSPINGGRRRVEALAKRLVVHRRTATNDADKDLFDHLFRRGTASERIRLAKLVSSAGAHTEWLDAMIDIAREPDPEALT